MVETEEMAALDFLTLKEVAKLLRITQRTLERLIASGQFPRPLKIGKCSRIPKSDFDDYLQGLFAKRDRVR